MSNDQPPRMLITEEDLAGSAVDERVEQLQAATSTPLVRSVGVPTSSTTGSSWWRGTVATLGLAGIVGGLVGWGASELVARPQSEDPWYGTSPITGTIIFIGLFAVVLGAVIAAWDGIEVRNWVKARAAALRALPYLVAGGVAGGFIAQKIYEAVMEGAWERAFEADTESEFRQAIEGSLHLGRGLGFGVAGALIGLALGAAAKSSKRAVNGAIGGVVGGFLGGFMFDYVADPMSDTSGVMPRLVALTLTGVAIGAAIGLVETVRREHWVEIVSGGMAGKQFILYHDQTVVGSGGECHITLIKDPGIAPSHLVLSREGQSLVLRPSFQVPVLVNGMPSAGQALNDGDLVQAGQTVLRYRAKAASMPLPGGLR